MSDVIQILIDDLKAECNFHTNGVCQTQGCLIRGGYKVGERVSYSLATCLPKEQAAAIAQLTESNRQLREELEHRADAREKAEAVLRATIRAGESTITGLQNDIIVLGDRLHKSRTALAAAKEALESIHIYGNDTLSGRVDGPDDREWQRRGVDKMTKRAANALARIAECEKEM